TPSPSPGRRRRRPPSTRKAATSSRAGTPSRNGQPSASPWRASRTTRCRRSSCNDRGPVKSMTALDAPPTRTPSWPARLPFYYGWVNVLVAAVAMSATLPGRTYGLGLIKEPLRANLGISDFRFNTLNFWAIVLGALVVLPVGRLIDRVGTR